MFQVSKKTLVGTLFSLYFMRVFLLGVVFCYGFVVNASENQPLQAQNLEETIQETFQDSLEYLIATDNAIAAKYNKKQAFNDLLPQLNLSGNQYNYDQETAGNRIIAQERTATTLSLKQNILGSGRVSYLYVRAKTDHKIALQQMRQTEIDVLLKIISSYVNLYVAQQNLKSANASHESLLQNYEAIFKRSQFGDASQTLLKQTQARLEIGKADFIQAESQVTIRLIALETVTSKKITRPIAEIMLSRAQKAYLPKTLAQAVETALTISPNIAIAKLEVADARALKKRSPLPFLPNVNIEAGRTVTQNSLNPSEQTEDYVSLNFSYDITPGSAASAYQQVSARLRGAENNLRQAYKNAKDNTIVAWENFITADVILNARKVALAASQSAFEGIEVEYQLSQRSQLEFLDAQNDHWQAQQAYIQAVGNRVISHYQLLAQIGTLSFSQFVSDDHHEDES